MIEINPEEARKEFFQWPTDENSVFARLRIWMAGDNKVIPGVEAGKHIVLLNDEVFWDEYHQQDLLTIIGTRWNDFSADCQKEIGNRLLKRCECSLEPFDVALISLCRIQVLIESGCRFHFDWNTERTRLQQICPEWRP
jgi:hypothetical protein